MTTAHKILHRYINQNLKSGCFTFQDIGLDKVLIRDKNGGRLILTMNLYCDIMDADTNVIYAKSDLPHDLMAIGYRTPNTWIEVERSQKSFKLF